MLASSSGESGKLEQGLSSLLKNPRRLGAGDTINKPSSRDRFASFTFINFSIVVLVLASIYLQCGESRQAKNQYITDPSVSFPSACFCGGKFYSSCPNQPGCITRRQKPLKVALSPDPYELLHDSEHPDHVELFNSAKGKWPITRDPVLEDEPMIQSGGTGTTPNLDDIMTTDIERVVRHRKVYVSEKLNERDPVIHPIELTIPVRIKNEQDPPLPPPKPVFKLRKYTTYETKPEIEMVPITTTVYKPVGVSRDQIIDYKKSQ